MPARPLWPGGRPAVDRASCIPHPAWAGGLLRDRGSFSRRAEGVTRRPPGECGRLHAAVDGGPAQHTLLLSAAVTSVTLGLHCIASPAKSSVCAEGLSLWVLCKPYTLLLPQDPRQGAPSSPVWRTRWPDAGGDTGEAPSQTSGSSSPPWFCPDPVRRGSSWLALPRWKPSSHPRVLTLGSLVLSEGVPGLPGPGTRHIGAAR